MCLQDCLKKPKQKQKQKVETIYFLTFHQNGKSQVVNAINENPRVYLELQHFAWQLYALLLCH